VGEQREPTPREARPDEIPVLREIEVRADARFESVGIGPFVAEETTDHCGQAVLVLVIGDPPVGFASVGMVDGLPHLRQVAVEPDHGRRGLGRALVEAVCTWARSEQFHAITLTTYRDVPWNGPFYRSLGFVVLETLTPGLIEIRGHERSLGEDGFGPRVAMRRDL
jgi:GNAT superfamily N-acetyltransferase